MHKKDKKVQFEDLVHLTEDQTQMQNKWTGAHQMSQRQSPQTLTLMDIMSRERSGKGRHTQHPNNVKAPSPQIGEESPLLQLLGDMLIQGEEVKKIIRKVSTSPVLEDDTKSKAKLNAIMTKLVAIDNVVKKIGEDIDAFHVEINPDTTPR